MNDRSQLTALDRYVLDDFRERENRRYDFIRRVHDLGFRREVQAELDQSAFAQEETENPDLDLESNLAEESRQSDGSRAEWESEYAQLRAESIRLASDEARRRREMRKGYFKKHGDWYKARQGNPELWFAYPIADWSSPILIPIGGMHGGYSDMGTYDFSEEMVVDDDGYVYFYPSVFVSTGGRHDCGHRQMELVQGVTYRWGELAPGRGNFEVEQIQIDLSGAGNCERRTPDRPCRLVRRPYSWGDPVNLSIEVHIAQAERESTDIPSVTSETVLKKTLYPTPTTGVRSGSVLIEPVSMELGITPYDVHFILDSPDHGGGVIYLWFKLTIRASAGDRHARSGLTFSREDDDEFGLRLGCISLEGSYER